MNLTSATQPCWRLRRGRSVLPLLLLGALASGCATGTDQPSGATTDTSTAANSTTASTAGTGAAVSSETAPAAASETSGEAAASGAADSDTTTATQPAGTTTSEPAQQVADPQRLAELRDASSSVSPPVENTAASPHLIFVARLIEESSAAMQVKSSDTPAALARRNEAREIYRRALAANAAGDIEQAEALGKEATQVMFEAVRLAESEEVVEAKHERDYARRLESVRALLKAHENVGAEDDLGSDYRRSREQIRERVRRAEMLYDQGNLEPARQELNDAYVALRLSIQTARQGMTKVRSLDFATKEEEYDHELQRNSTHQDLVRLFMQDSGTSEGAKKMIESFLTRGDELRDQAESQASRGDHAAAVESLEESTGQYIRALRTVGIFIPG